MVRAHVLRLLDLAGIERLSDLNPTRVQAALSAMREKKLSLQTCNHALRAIKSFDRWLWKDGRRPEASIAHLAGFNVATDRRHDRGVLTAEEWAKLLEATRAGEPFRGLSGSDRAVLYIVASYTGLRASELASLTPAGFDLKSLTVTVQAGYTKNGKKATLPLRPDLAKLLGGYLEGRQADASVWPGTWAEKGADMLKLDLEAAGVPYVDQDRRFRDFHSLRHRFGTGLAMANVPTKVTHSLMRHSSITLTMDRYSHVGLHDVAGAVEKLPPIESGSKVESMKATGTDGRSIKKRVALPLPYSGDPVGHELAWRTSRRGRFQ